MKEVKDRKMVAIIEDLKQFGKSDTVEKVVTKTYPEKASGDCAGFLIDFCEDNHIILGHFDGGREKIQTKFEFELFSNLIEEGHEVYEDEVADQVCNDCNTELMYNSKKENFYCPRCDS
jgi:hypothetical protein